MKHFEDAEMVIQEMLVQNAALDGNSSPFFFRKTNRAFD